MPIIPDRDPKHAATETHSDPSGVSVHVNRHPSPPSAAVTLARASRRDFAAPPTRLDDVNDCPRSVDTGDGPGTVLHAKAVVQDND